MPSFSSCTVSSLTVSRRRSPTHSLETMQFYLPAQTLISSPQTARFCRITLPHTVVTSTNKFLFADPNHKLYCQTVHDPVLSVIISCVSSACCPCTRLGCRHVTHRTFTWLSTLPPPDESHPGRSVGERKYCPTYFIEGKLKHKDM